MTTEPRRCPTTPSLTDVEVRNRLEPHLLGDRTLIDAIAALRQVGHDVQVEDADGSGPDQALIIARVNNQRVRLTAQPW